MTAKVLTLVPKGRRNSCESPMTRDQIITVVTYYKDRLNLVEIEEERPRGFWDRVLDRPPVHVRRELKPPRRWQDFELYYDEFAVPTREDQLRHAAWMTRAILDGLASGEMGEGKAFRWLGFLQGVLWTHGIFKLDDLKTHNRFENNP